MDAEELRKRRREKLLNRGKQIESGAITGIQEVIEEKTPQLKPSTSEISPKILEAVDSKEPILNQKPEEFKRELSGENDTNNDKSKGQFEKPQIKEVKEDATKKEEAVDFKKLFALQ